MHNIKVDLGNSKWSDMDWIGLEQDRERWGAFVKTVMNLQVPYNAGKLLNGCATDSLSPSS
jgi:hypothetical protein